MTCLVCNPQEGRLTTLEVVLTAQNTTWFDYRGKPVNVASISDVDGGLLIKLDNHSYPLWLHGISRKDIGCSRRKAKKLYTQEIY